MSTATKITLGSIVLAVLFALIVVANLVALGGS
jgi:hypothetical protein